MGIAIGIIILIIIVCIVVASAKKTSAELKLMPPGSASLGFGFYRTPTGEIWTNGHRVTRVHAEVNATQRHSLTRAATVVGAATLKTNGYLVISYADAAGLVQVKNLKISGAGPYRKAMAFAARANAVAGQLPHQPGSDGIQSY